MPQSPGKIEPQTNVKETIESILVAFILAFVFRAFVVEAFVIPTGSMAPTLLGAHMRFYCPDCGYEYAVNYNAPNDPNSDDVVVPGNAEVQIPERGYDPQGAPRTKVVTAPRVYNLTCPNCGYKLPRTDANDPDNAATGAPVYYGDRILVLKYLYLLHDPQRWDVVVFKSPVEPDKYDYSQNYIKRLVGKPGETLMVLDGDIYTATKPPSAGLLPSDFQIQTKPRHAQDALWRIIYDNDFVPQGKPRGVTAAPWKQPWQVIDGTGWNLEHDRASSRAFHFDNSSGSGTLAFSAKADGQTHAFTDWLAYDMLANTDDPHYSRQPDLYDVPPAEPPNNVSDLKLDFFYERHPSSGPGPLRMRLTKQSDAFIAELFPDKVRLLQGKLDEAGNVVDQRFIADKPFTLPGKAVHVQFQNVDYHVTLFVDGVDLVHTSTYAPNVSALLDAYEHHVAEPKPTVQLAAERQACDITHLSLWRDIYYTNRNGSQSLLWASPEDFPRHLATLGPDEFFVCGDNSPLSFDARYWPYPINLPDENLDVQSGRVPRRFLLGRAFFVYWPAGYRPFHNAPGLAPDFGDMRFIH